MPKELPWKSNRHSKVGGFDMLTRFGLRVPDTKSFNGISEADLRAYAEELLTAGGEWLVRFDAAPEVRFGISSGRIPYGETSGLTARESAFAFLHELWVKLQASDGVILAQRLVPKLLDGAAFANAANQILVETHPPRRGGNFLRDGTRPSRWLIKSPERVECWCGDEDLPMSLVNALWAAYERLPKALCLEWVLEAGSEETYFVDAKQVGNEFLANVECTHAVGSFAVWPGSALGHLRFLRDDEPSYANVNHIAVCDKALVSYLSRFNERTVGVIFVEGALLSHAVVYSSQLRVPICLQNDFYVCDKSNTFCEMYVSDSKVSVAFK